MNTVISPSLLACDFLNIENELKHFEDVKHLWFHLDIMDGHFVPNLTFGQPIIKKISQKTKQPLDAHLMVSNPEFYIESLKDMNLHNFTWHIEAQSEDVLSLISKAKKHYSSVGLSIKPKSNLNLLSDEILCAIDLVLVMSVEPGFGGQKFIEETYERISALVKRRKNLGLSFSIQVDGGVNEHNAKKLIDAGADNLVAGSYIFKEGPNKYLEKINSLR
ncbi:MAG: ribulose-phosphate 3-epimerase [Halobacteriovorax sp.]|nr:ribulose-phosphate 3-epimerase [Halobacteriovorax sp.]